MSAVAKASGVSMGTLYQYFGTRKAVLAAWEEQALARMTEEVVRVIARIVETAPSRRLETSTFMVVMSAIDAVERHLTTYPRAEAALGLMARTRRRRELLEQAAQAVAGALAASNERHRVRPSDLMAAARVAVRAIPLLVEEVTASDLAPDAKAAMCREIATMVVLLLVKDPDESLLRVDGPATGGKMDIAQPRPAAGK
jgi:AcrR family transcriptional regulator